MKLRALTLINWANLPARTYEFANVTLITGGSGVGKTTLLDAIQTNLTAATKGLYHYNPGQDEVAQQSRKKETRTLASYVLGGDDGAYSRPDGAYGYVIAHWIPSSNESLRPFVSIIAVSAYLDVAGKQRIAKEDDFRTFLLYGDVTIKDFVCREEGQETVIAPADLHQHLKMTRPDLVKELATCKGKEEYLAQLYAAFRGKAFVNKNEAKAAARAISRFMSYKAVDDLDLFVRQEILEKQDLSVVVRQVADMMRNISAMEKEAHAIEEGIGLLKKAESAAVKYIETTLDEACAGYEMHKREAYQEQQKYLKLHKNVAEAKRQKAEKDKLQQVNQAEFKQCSEQLRVLEIRSSGIAALGLKEQLEQKIETLEADISAQASQLLQQNGKRAANLKRASDLHQVLESSGYAPGGEDWSILIEDMAARDDWDMQPLAKILSQGDFEALMRLSAHAPAIAASHRALCQALQRAGETIRQQSYEMDRQYDALKQRQQSLSAEITQLEKNNQVRYPQKTERAVALIKQHYPEADVRVLCDHIEVLDPDWQVAIETLLGNNRYIILVDQDHEAKAMALLKQHDISKTHVGQGALAIKDAKGRAVPEKSICHLIRSDHQIAEAYFFAQYGTFMQVDDLETLRHTRRGIMQDGSASSSYRLYVERLSESELVFGREARKRALEAKKAQLAEVEKNYEQAGNVKQELRVWLDAAKDMQAIELNDALTALLSAHQRVAQTRRQIEALDLSEGEELLAEIEAIKKRGDDLRRTDSELLKTIGGLETSIAEWNKRSASHEDRRDNFERQAGEAEAFLRKLCQYRQSADCDALLQRIDDSLDVQQPRFAGHYGEDLNKSQMRLHEAAVDFNRQSVRGCRIDLAELSELHLNRRNSPETRVLCFERNCRIAAEIDAQLNMLRNDILAHHKTKLTEMTERFNDTFFTHLCHVVDNAINGCKQNLRVLNGKLRHFVFGEEYYEFTYEWQAEYKEYANFFSEASRKSAGLDDIFSGQGLSDQSQKIYAMLREKLLAEDLAKSLRDLERLTDARNYRSYDILKHLPDGRTVSLKRSATGSGGQLESPSYVIRAAALASALKFEEGPHLQTVLIDESFSKMDETRCADVLNYLEKQLGLQLLFVVPDKNSGPLHQYVDRVYEVSKHYAGVKRGELSTFVMVNRNDLKRDKVAELWKKGSLAIENQAHQLDFMDLLAAQDLG